MKIKRITKEVFKRMGWKKIRIETKEEGDNLNVEVEVSDPKLLIGERGENLRSLQRILRIMCIKELGEGIFLNLDVNKYKKRKTEYLKEVAGEIADEVSLSGKPHALPAMNSYERRIIHMELSQRADVRTESEGEEPRRRVVVKPV